MKILFKIETHLIFDPKICQNCPIFNPNHSQPLNQNPTKNRILEFSCQIPHSLKKVPKTILTVTYLGFQNTSKNLSTGSAGPTKAEIHFFPPFSGQNWQFFQLRLHSNTMKVFGLGLLIGTVDSQGMEAILA